MSKPDFETATPREIEAWARKKILAIFGDKLENQSDVHARNGRFYITVPQCEPLVLRRSEIDKFWRKLKIAEGE